MIFVKNSMRMQTTFVKYTTQNNGFFKSGKQMLYINKNI